MGGEVKYRCADATLWGLHHSAMRLCASAGAGVMRCGLRSGSRGSDEGDVLADLPRPGPAGPASRVEGRRMRRYPPGMTVSLRRLARSRGLRTLAVLAWLMLVSTALVAAPMEMGMHGSAAHAMAATGVALHHGSARSNHPAASMPDRACCGDQMAQGCHCHSVCGSVLHSVAVVVPTAMLFAVVYGPPAAVRAPSPNTAVPLRPPLG